VLREVWLRGLFMAVAFTATAMLVALEFRQRDIDAEGVYAFRQENLVWNASQLRFELTRTLLALKDFALEPHDRAADTVATRFDVLWSRAAIFESGAVAERLMAVEGGPALSHEMTGALERHETTMMALAEASPAAVRAAIEDFSRLLPRAQTFTAATANFEEGRMGAVQQAIIDSNRLNFWKSIATALAAFSLAIAGLLMARADRARLHEQQRRTREAEREVETKRRFMTMMSHELRTPMNGMLGMLSLLENQGLTERQKVLMGVARRSASEMVGLVEDLLDLSELQVGGQGGDMGDASLDEIAQETETLLARRLGVRPPGLVVEILGDPREVIWIERDMTPKIGRQMALFLIERLGCENVRIVLARRGWDLHIDVSAPADGARAWSLDAFEGPLTEAGAAIATDAIGAALAMAFARQMHGRIVTDRAGPGRLGAVAILPAGDALRLQAAAFDADARADAATHAA
jgi:signal transduction histidine kinase